MKKKLDQKLEELLKLIAEESHPAANKLRAKLLPARRIAADEWPEDKPAEAEKPAK